MTQSGKIAWVPQVFLSGQDCRSGGEHGLELNVIFTTSQGTSGRSQSCGKPSQLSARIRLRVAQVVPFAVPDDDPPASVAFIEERCRALVAECTETSDVHVDGLSRLSRLRIFAAVSAKPVACRKLFAPGG